MTKKRWFRFYIDAWFSGTLGLTPNEIAAYLTILCELYDNDGFAALDLDVMSRRCGMRPSSFRKALDALIERRKLTLEGGFLTSKAVSEEIKSREKLGNKSEESRRNRTENDNEIRAIQSKMPSYIESRIQNKKETFEVSAKSGALEDESKSPAVAGFIKRREMYKRKGIR